MKCPACDGQRHRPHKVTGVFECKRCGAIHGTCYRGDSYTLVLPYWAMHDVPPERCRYFDLDTLGSGGIERRHGWFDTESRRIVQTG